MKKLSIILLMLCLSISALAQNGRQLYEKYSDRPGMQAVYISPAMFRMMGKIPDVEFQSDKVNFSSLVKSMTGFYILESGDKATGAELKAEVNKYIKSGHYELLMESKDNGEVVRMYTAGSEETVTSFIMLADEGEDVSFISFDGKMNRQEFENLIAEAVAE